MGNKRRDITPLPVRFWTLTKFPNYVTVFAVWGWRRRRRSSSQ